MKLELFDEDLRPEHKMCHATDTTFDKFNEAAQNAIKAVGKGTYHNSSRSRRNVIYPPKSTAGQ